MLNFLLNEWMECMGLRPITQQKANNLQAGRKKLMKSIKVAVFFDIIYPKVISHNTVFIAMKYMLHLIYISLGLLYFLCDKVRDIPRARGGSSSRAHFFGILKRMGKI